MLLRVRASRIVLSCYEDTRILRATLWMCYSSTGLRRYLYSLHTSHMTTGIEPARVPSPRHSVLQLACSIAVHHCSNAEFKLHGQRTTTRSSYDKAELADSHGVTLSRSTHQDMDVQLRGRLTGGLPQRLESSLWQYKTLQSLPQASWGNPKTSRSCCIAVRGTEDRNEGTVLSLQAL